MIVRPLVAAASAAAMSVLMASALPAAAADVDVGVSIGISQPGVYGRIDIGRYPQPQVIMAQPVIVTPPPRVVYAQPQPVYMWVPPGHRKDWKRYCRDYGACATPVVFVRDDWYEHNVKPHGKGNGKGHGNGKGKHGRDD
jgi:hypothetical protein